MDTPRNATVGRPRLFDEDVVLDELTALFWSQGYSQTSMHDIVERSGVHKPSLYRTFGTKDQLFATILRRYLAARKAVIVRLIDQAGPGVVGIHRFLDMFETDAISGTGQDGCLMVMAANELRGSLPSYADFAGDNRRALRELLGPLVATTLPDETTDPDLVDQRTDLLSMCILGMQVTIRSDADPAEIHRYFRAMHATVDTW